MFQNGSEMIQWWSNTASLTSKLLKQTTELEFSIMAQCPQNALKNCCVMAVQQSPVLTYPPEVFLIERKWDSHIWHSPLVKNGYSKFLNNISVGAGLPTGPHVPSTWHSILRSSILLSLTLSLVPLNHDNGACHGYSNIIYNYLQYFLYQLHHLKSPPRSTKGSRFSCLQSRLGVVVETSSRLATSGSRKRLGLRISRVQNYTKFN